MTLPEPPRAVLFDLLTALLDSWTLWNRSAGSEEDGRRWRMEYLRLTYGAGQYVPYESLLHASARAASINDRAVTTLLAAWDSLEPWPDVAFTVSRLPRSIPLGVVTNCSDVLAARAVARVQQLSDRAFDVVISAESAGAYKPDPRPYRAALDALNLSPQSVLFVAGSPGDLNGASNLGMTVAWHNAAGLTRPVGVAAPIVEGRTLAPVLHAAGTGDGTQLIDGRDLPLDELVTLSRHTFRDTYAFNHTDEQIDRYLDAQLTADRWQGVLRDPRNRTFVALAATGAPLAYLIWRDGSAPPDGPVGSHPCEIVRIYVHDLAKGRRLGAALVREAIRLTRAHGGDSLWLAVAQYNDPAIAFYERMGFVRSGITSFDFAGTVEPDFVMRLGVQGRAP
jgi:2-haloacid dehalogenase